MEADVRWLLQEVETLRAIMARQHAEIDQLKNQVAALQLGVRVLGERA